MKAPTKTTRGPIRAPAPASNGDCLRLPLSSGRRLIVTRWHETELYQITPPDGGAVHWEAVAVLNGRTVRRRFPSELYAVAWLSTANEPFCSNNPFDPEEFNGPYRTASILCGGRAMPAP